MKSVKLPFTLKLLSLVAVTAGCLLRPDLATAQVEPGFKSLFNGKDLAGWTGRTNHWSVEQGAITGVTTTENPAKGNNFLIAQADGKNLVVDDFELRLSYRFQSAAGNSGVQYRSVDKGNHVVNGYQADMETGKNYSGILYEEGGRGILAKRGEKVVIREDSEKPDKPKIEVTGSVGASSEIQAAIKEGDWNDYVVIAKGNHLQHFINGKLTVDVTDEQGSKAARAGILALQIHTGPPMKIQFKDIRIKSLK
jgi:predicted secreted protein